MEFEVMSDVLAVSGSFIVEARNGWRLNASALLFYITDGFLVSIYRTSVVGFRMGCARRVGVALNCILGFRGWAPVTKRMNARDDLALPALPRFFQHPVRGLRGVVPDCRLPKLSAASTLISSKIG